MWKVLSVQCIQHTETSLKFTPLEYLWRVDPKSLDIVQGLNNERLSAKTINTLELECAIWAYGRKLEPEQVKAVA